MNKKLSREIRAVLFDVDNTLLASNDFVREHIRATVIRIQNDGGGVHMPEDEEIRLVLAKNLQFEEIFQQLFMGQHNGQQIWEFVLKTYRAHAQQKPYQGTSGALAAVARLKEVGLEIGLVTNRVRMLEERLVQAGFRPADFFCMSMPAKTEFKKPHPRAFEEAMLALKKKGIHNDQILVLGDHPDDYYSAVYQGMRFAAVLGGETRREQFLEYGLENELIFDNLDNIEKILETAVKIFSYKASLSRTSALDGRHFAITYPLRHYFSEYALHKYRVMVEIEHIIALSEFFPEKIIRQMSQEEKNLLRDLYRNFSWQEAYQILQYDHLSRNGIGPTEHDVKSCELWIREKLTGTSLADIIAQIHMFVTSEDINNLAYKTMLADGINNVFVPTILQLTEQLALLAETYAADPIMSRTHLQPASPTTFGKIFGVFLSRLTDGLRRLQEMTLTGKINGAVGNYNAFAATYPELDWKGYSLELTKRLGFGCDLWTDQRGPHIDIVQTFQIIQEIGNIIRDFSTDLCLYAAFGTMYFTKVETHVGSSVMPHKINPWFAEVAEGNIRKANYMINSFSNELDVSRLQRDLSDHDLERSYGEAVGYILIAAEHLLIAMSLIHPDRDAARGELRAHPEIVAEAVQTILRKHGEEKSYDLLKKEFRGKNTSSEHMLNFVRQLPITENIKNEILEVIRPEDYTGLAQTLARDAVEKYKLFRQSGLNKPYLQNAKK